MVVIVSGGGGEMEKGDGDVDCIGQHRRRR